MMGLKRGVPERRVGAWKAKGRRVRCSEKWRNGEIVGVWQCCEVDCVVSY